jgi:uncharacterized membrane protein YoaK (UPF0700 family)
MLTKPVPLWIQMGGFTLAAIGGCINAVALLCAHSHAVSHMSGTVTNLGMEIAQHNLPLGRQALLIIVFFFLGSVLSGLIIRQSQLKAGRRYGVTLTCEAILLALAAYFLGHDSEDGLYVASMACGLQNGMATNYSGAVIRTTHMTGIVTDLGIAIGLTARGLKADWRRMRLYLVLFAGFLTGGVLGTFGFGDFGCDTLLFPAAVAGVVGIGYTVWSHFWPATVPASVRSHPSLPVIRKSAPVAERS